MSVWAITMVKDEVDVIEPVMRHVAAQGVTGIIVADNGSTDGTWQLLGKMHHELDCDLLLIPDPEVAYYQSAKMSLLAEQAHQSGATWVWPFDADEVWYYGTEGRRLADVVEQADGDVIYARLWHHFCTALDDDECDIPFKRIVYRERDEAPLHKVIVRWLPGCVITAGNHDVVHPNGPRPSTLRDVQVRHFPYRSEDQFVRKAINGSRAYAATDLPYETGQHWRDYGKLYKKGGQRALRRAFQAHYYYDLPSASGLVYDPARLDS